ncbi:major tail protein [Lysinibacillus pakistanensis]|uniref:Phage tail protein n=1 Tax=Lysinibacillus pakistanensis TaxID=759811 RepID=A0AAX3WZE5_9BACI|nr:major tail protein [Lysinibacillus pakistanensis]MDM5231488.1 phage tail protein [Lysinibacillus pakistanensis]WHY47035.1 phage tail protein [Lysinibacillus pakistanensis]WHY52046.1 phage tail protein [Lysinibacillus pakistanensis]
MAENKVQFGIKNVHYAVATEGADDTITYATPVPFPGATALNLDPKGEQSDFYADDRVYYTSSTNSGYEGTLTVAALLQQFRVDVLGDQLGTDKVLTENADAKPKKIALLFEFDGDVKATRHALYNVTVSRPGMAGETKTETTEPGTQELSFTAAPTVTGIVKRSTTAETEAAIYDAWYTKVFEPTEVPTP